MSVLTMPVPRRVESKLYGKAKVSKQFMITEHALKFVDELADELKVSRSECLERIIRTANQAAVKQFDPEVAA